MAEILSRPRPVKGPLKDTKFPTTEPNCDTLSNARADQYACATELSYNRASIALTTWLNNCGAIVSQEFQSALETTIVRRVPGYKDLHISESTAILSIIGLHHLSLQAFKHRALFSAGKAKVVFTL